MKRFALCLSLLCCLAVSGCFIIPSVVEDERSLSTQYDDAGIKTDIAAALLKEDATKANGVNVHCFEGQVFLVGEADKNFRAFAIKTAAAVKGVAHVTPHWFAAGTGDTISDTALEAKIDGALLFTQDLPSAQVVVDVWGGHVVLSGMMKDQADISKTIAVTRGVSGVKSVTSYLFPPVK